MLVIMSKEDVMQLNVPSINAQCFHAIADALAIATREYTDEYAEQYCSDSYGWTLNVINPSEYSDVISSSPHICSADPLHDLGCTGYEGCIQISLHRTYGWCATGIDSYGLLHELLPQLDCVLQHDTSTCICGAH
jgi:hypothetical protein